MIGDVEHFFFHLQSNILKSGFIDRLVDRQTGKLHRFPGAKSVKFDPGVFPGMLMIGNIGADLSGKDHKALSAFYRVCHRVTCGVHGI